jgi:hypothetical protein
LKRNIVVKICSLLFILAATSEMLIYLNQSELNFWSFLFFVFLFMIVFAFLFCLPNIIFNVSIDKFFVVKKIGFLLFFLRLLFVGIFGFEVIYFGCMIFGVKFSGVDDFTKSLELLGFVVPYLSITIFMNYLYKKRHMMISDLDKKIGRIQSPVRNIILRSCTVLFIFILVYIVFVKISILPLENAVKYSFLSNGLEPEKVSKYITNDVFYQINYDKYYFKIYKKKLHLVTIFAVLGLKRGYIWMNYSFEAYDKKGKIDHGSWDIPIKLDVKRVNGTWKIIKKYEEP